MGRIANACTEILGKHDKKNRLVPSFSNEESELSSMLLTNTSTTDT